MREILQKQNPAIHFVSSFVGAKDLSRGTLFHYHLGRTGGLTFDHAFLNAYEHFYRYSCSIAGKELDWPGTMRLDDHTVPLLALKQFPFAFVTGHLDYGVHKLIPIKTHLITWVRDPVKRIVSLYTRVCSAAGVKPTGEGLTAHIKNERYQNDMVRALNPDAFPVLTMALDAQTGYHMRAGVAKDAQAAIDNLNKNFEAFATNDDVNDLLGYYLSVYGLPNVIFENLAKTIPEYTFDAKDFRDEILKANVEDQKLYEYILANKKMPTLAVPESAKISEATLIIYENEDDRRTSLTNYCLLPTAFVKQKLTEDPVRYSKIKNLYLLKDELAR